MKKLFAISFFMLLISVTTFSQYPYNTGSVTTSSKIWELGAEYEYNCGHDLAQHDIGVRYDGFQNKNNWNIGISYDFGKTKTKNGYKECGFGLSAGYRYGFSYGTHGNLFGGVRATFEFDKWKDKDGKEISKETVFVPKIEGGYQYIFGTTGHIYTTPSIGYGYGIKLNATGTEVKADESGRFVPGISMGYRF